jgi:hypothetical protein
MYLGFENPGMTGGDCSALLPSLLLGGVLNGDTSAASDEGSGASVARPAGSTVCGLAGIFGFPARLTGGGTGGAEESGLSLLRGSAAGAAPVWDGKRGCESKAGVASRLGILKVFVPFVADAGGVGESSAACGLGREGRGECICGSNDLGGDFGD